MGSSDSDDPTHQAQSSARRVPIADSIVGGIAVRWAVTPGSDDFLVDHLEPIELSDVSFSGLLDLYDRLQDL